MEYIAVSRVCSSYDYRTSETLATECYAGWHYYNNYCYYASTQADNWGIAQNDCVNTPGADLTSISDWAELDFIVNISYV